MTTNFIFSLVCFGVTQVVTGKVMVGVTIHSYSNPNGTAYVESTTSRKCCDGPQRFSCETGDTCDTYFDICIGSMVNDWGCKGAFMKSNIFNNSNNLTTELELSASSDYWSSGMAIFVFIRDDDSHGNIQAHDHIDSLFDRLNFNPGSQDLTAHVYDYEWVGKTQMSLSVKVWCAPNYYGNSCASYCEGIQQIATCNRNTGQLTCSGYSDEILLEFKNTTRRDQNHQLVLDINSFIANEMCPPPGLPEVDYPNLDLRTNTLAFTAYCDYRQITALEFESLLQLKTDSTLTAYFPPGIIRGPAITPKDYGEHVVPNVYLGIEIKSFYHPLGTSYVGTDVTGTRRCCDVPKTDNCGVEADKCDIQLSICIGKLVNGNCIGAFVASATFANVTSLDICGPTLLDHSNGTTFVSHPMIGALRITENITTIDVAVKDMDLNGLSFDAIDQLTQNVTLKIGANVTDAQEIEVDLQNIVTLKLHVLAWCAPGHSGPTCTPVNGTDNCTLGWYGPDCSMKQDLCHPNPCGSGQCDVVRGMIKCSCPPGFQGPTCNDDVNECNMNVCQNNATCENTVGAFICHCTSGWDGLICTNRAPACFPPPCVHGTCSQKANGGYTCKCDNGWMGQNCEEIYKCDNTTCPHGKCAMLNGLYFCICLDGYMGPHCSQDKDECKDIPCKNSGTCINTPGSFSCQCPNGYSGKICENSTCPAGFCQNGGTCLSSNNTGNISCLCPRPFTGKNCEQRIDFCANVTCDNNSTCIALPPDFQCTCDSGWSGKTCDVDVNECSKHICQNNASCTNSPGSYSCSCKNGWIGQNCQTDFDECGNRTICNHGFCINFLGGFRCMCEQGYAGDLCESRTQYCQNVTCNNNGTCLDDLSGYLCACKPGWMGSNCQEDIDECKLNVCGINQLSCTNLPGSYKCTCKTGWKGVNCSEDVDECWGEPCNGNGNCTNTVGSYKCDCDTGITGASCDVFINQCAFDRCLNGGTCHMTQNGPECLCTHAWTGQKCESDVNECDMSPCHNAATCSNTNGSYTCSCSPGWSGLLCETDVNECISLHCNNNGVCSNSPGSFNCACQTGWQGQLCEVKRLPSLTGILIDMQFITNVSSAMQQKVISSLFSFIQNYVCSGKTVHLYISSIIGNVVQFISTCGTTSVTLNLIQNAYKNIPGPEMATLFPVPVESVQKSQTQQPTKSPSPTTSWAHDHWPVLAGCIGAAVIITVVVVIGCIRDKRNFCRPLLGSERFRTALPGKKLKMKENGGFTNPLFSSD